MLHPACLPHPSQPIEALLGISSEEALAIVYGGDDAARVFVVTDPGRSALAVGTRLSLVELERWRDAGLGIAHGAQALRALLAGRAASNSSHVARVFSSLDAAPEWMCPTVVPIPGTALLRAVEKQERLAQLRVPEVVLEGAQTGTQRAFDHLFLVLCQSLDARAREGAAQSGPT